MKAERQYRQLSSRVIQSRQRNSGLDIVDNRINNMQQLNFSHRPIQRLIRLDGKDYDQIGVFRNDEVFERINKLNPGRKMGDLVKLANDSKIYDAHNNLEIIPNAIPIKSERDLALERIQTSSEEIRLEQRKYDYPIGKTLFAPIDHAIIVINDGPIEFVGTGGLIGCVEVMIEYCTETDKGYLVAHVNSAISKNIPEINRQLTIMITALGEALGRQINWNEFVRDEDTKKLTLVRSAGLGEQELLINMGQILAESGAHMRLVSSTSVSMRITPRGAEYYDNRIGRPKMDYRTSPGYPFPEGEE